MVANDIETLPPSSPKLLARQQSSTLAETPSWFLESLNKFKNPSTAVMSTLGRVLQESSAATMMGLQDDLNTSMRTIQRTFVFHQREGFFRFTHLAGIKATCEQFVRNITLIVAKAGGVVDREALLARSVELVEKSIESRERLIEKSFEHLFLSHRKQQTILIHGENDLILGLLKMYFAKQSRRKNVTLLITDDVLLTSAELKMLTERGGCVVSNRAVAFFMETVDVVLLGTYAACEDGGIVGRIGSLSIAVLAKEYRRPLYAMVESSQFARMFPMSQRDLARTCNKMLVDLEIPGKKESTNRRIKLLQYDDTNLVCDYTPPKYIKALFTDLGILSTTAVQDAILKLYL